MAGKKTINGKQFQVDKRTVNLGIGGVLNLRDIMDRSAIAEEPNPTDIVVVRLEAKYDNVKHHFHGMKGSRKKDWVDEGLIFTVVSDSVEILEVREAPPEPEQMEISDGPPDESSAG
jgi:hypothetical protein